MKGFVVIAVLLLLLLSLYVATRFSQSLELFSLNKKSVTIAFLIIGFIILTSQFLINTGNFALNAVIHSVSSFWLYAILLALIAIIFCDLLRVVQHFTHFLPNAIIAHYALTKFVMLCCVAVIISASYVIGYVNFKNPQIKKLDISVNKITDNDTLNAVVISDVHLGYIVNKKMLKKYVNMINAQKPDVVFIVGDLVDMNITPVLQQNMDEELMKIKAKYGVFMVTGNHEFIGDAYKEKLEFARSCGINVLEDSIAEIAGKYLIIGRNDRSDQNRKSIAQLTQEIDKSKVLILLDHQPHDLEKTEEAGIDLQLSGHTHKGQFFPINLITKAIYEIDYGYLRKGNTHIYVSSGIGLWGPAVRLGSQSEILTLKIHK